MLSLKNGLILLALVSTGMIVGCKGKNTAAFAPLCTQDFSNAYAQLNQDAVEFTRMLDQDGRRNSRLTRAAQELYESCQDLQVAAQRQAQSQTCISSSNVNASAPISVQDFNDVCQQASRYLNRQGFDSRDFDRRGKFDQPDNQDSRHQEREENTKDNRWNNNGWSMKLTNPNSIRQALSRQQPMSVVNGQVITLRQATRSITQGQTACAIQAGRPEITAYQDLKILSVKNQSKENNVKTVLIVNEEDLKISCQKQGSISMSDVAMAFHGIIEFNN